MWDGSSPHPPAEKLSYPRCSVSELLVNLVLLEAKAFADYLLYFLLCLCCSPRVMETNKFYLILPFLYCIIYLFYMDSAAWSQAPMILQCNSPSVCVCVCV